MKRIVHILIIGCLSLIIPTIVYGADCQTSPVVQQELIKLQTEAAQIKRKMKNECPQSTILNLRGYLETGASFRDTRYFWDRFLLSWNLFGNQALAHDVELYYFEMNKTTSDLIDYAKKNCSQTGITPISELKKKYYETGSYTSGDEIGGYNALIQANSTKTFGNKKNVFYTQNGVPYYQDGSTNKYACTESQYDWDMISKKWEQFKNTMKNLNKKLDDIKATSGEQLLDQWKKDNNMMSLKDGNGTISTEKVKKFYGSQINQAKDQIMNSINRISLNPATTSLVSGDETSSTQKINQQKNEQANTEKTIIEPAAITQITDIQKLVEQRRMNYFTQYNTTIAPTYNQLQDLTTKTDNLLMTKSKSDSTFCSVLYKLGQTLSEICSNAAGEDAGCGKSIITECQ